MWPHVKLQSVPLLLSTQGVDIDSSQTLLSSSISQSNGKSFLRFSRYANNGGHVLLNLNQPLHFNWAKGSSSSISYHGANRGSFSVKGLGQGRSNP